MSSNQPTTSADTAARQNDGTAYVTAGIVAVSLLFSVVVWTLTPHFTLRLVGAAQSMQLAGLLKACPPFFVGLAAALAISAIVKEFLAARRKPLINFILLLTLCVMFCAWGALVWWASHAPVS
jgi:hypothetical protein